MKIKILKAFLIKVTLKESMSSGAWTIGIPKYANYGQEIMIDIHTFIYKERDHLQVLTKFYKPEKPNSKGSVTTLYIVRKNHSTFDF